jgi:hypothetical protein
LDANRVLKLDAAKLESNYIFCINSIVVGYRDAPALAGDRRAKFDALQRQVRQNEALTQWTIERRESARGDLIFNATSD